MRGLELAAREAVVDTLPVRAVGRLCGRFPAVGLALGLALGLAGCGGDGAPKLEDLGPLQKPLAPGVVELRYPEGEARWTRDDSFVELTAAIAPPSNHPKGEQVSIYLRLPAEGMITEGEKGLVLPPGSEIDRLEWVRWGAKRSLADVRGTRFDSEGRAFDHTLRRVRLEADTPLIGYEWPSKDADAHAAATQALIERSAQLGPALVRKGEKREKFLATLEHKNDCARCHVPGQSDLDKKTRGRVVARSTDGLGFYGLLDTLEDERTLESYGAFDPNRARTSVRVSCGDGEADYGEGDDARVRCPDAQHPKARYDAEIAQRDEPSRHQQLCRARRLLVDRMEPKLRAKYERALANCG